RIDAAIDYRASPDFAEALAAACPEGIDVHFDNVGGPQLEAALGLMRERGRVVMCGAISRYNERLPTPGPSNLFLVVTRRLRLQGFIVTDHEDQAPVFLADMKQWRENG